MEIESLPAFIGLKAINMEIESLPAFIGGRHKYGN
jgi:hypothetical protein